MTDGKRCGVDEADACTSAQFCVQICQQWHHHSGYQLDTARISRQGRKLAVQVELHILHVGVVMRLLEQDDDRHDLTRMQFGLVQQLVLP